MGSKFSDNAECNGHINLDPTPTTPTINSHLLHFYQTPYSYAGVAELVDAADLGSVGATCVGSSPTKRKVFKTLNNTFQHDLEALKVFKRHCHVL